MPTPDVSILIAVHNRADLTEACLRSLRATIPAHIAAEILLYDDHSTDHTPRLLAASADRITAYTRPDRGTFASNNNFLAARAAGRYLVMLNNDTVCRRGWLERLLARAESTPNLAVAGCLHLFPAKDHNAQRINHAGVTFDDNRMPRHLYEGMPGDLAAARLARKLQAVSAACWITPRDRFLDLGGFDEAFRNGHEDLDFCFRAAKAGRDIWYEGAAVIEHHGGSSPGRFTHTDDNERLFQSRWLDAVNPDLDELTTADGTDWNPHNDSYEFVRRLWRFGPLRSLARPLLSTQIGTASRRKLLQFLAARRAGKVTAPTAATQPD